jgi:membrane-associated phospholipid phosphatase
MTDAKRDLDQLYDEFAKTGTLKENLYDWHGLNDDAFFAINSIHASWYDDFMLLVTQIGDYSLFPYYLVGLFIFFVVSAIVRKLLDKAGTKQYVHRWVGTLAVLVIGFGAMGITTKYLKDDFAYPRPYMVIDADNITVLERPPKYKDKQSFPSGHSVFTAFMITALWPILSGSLRWFGATLALPVRVGR